MTEMPIGQRYWKYGDHRHVWVVESLVRVSDGSGHAAILAEEHGNAREEIGLDHLRDREIYTPVPPDPHLGAEEE